MWLLPSDYEKLGELLKGARGAAGLNQAGLASKLGKPQSFVSSYESGQRRVDVLEFIKIARVLGADPTALFQQILSAEIGKKLGRRKSTPK